MKLTDINKQVYNINQYTEIEYLGETKTNRGFFRWILAAFIFFPLVLLWFFVGTPAYRFKINGVVVLLNVWEKDRLLARVNSGTL